MNVKLNFSVGGMCIIMGSETSGQMNLIAVFPSDVFDKKDQFVDDYWNWYNNLNPLNQADSIKIKAADKLLTPIVDSIDSANGEGMVKYAKEKKALEWLARYAISV